MRPSPAFQHRRRGQAHPLSPEHLCVCWMPNRQALPIGQVAIELALGAQAPPAAGRTPPRAGCSPFPPCGAGGAAPQDPVGCACGQGVIGAVRGVEAVGPVSVAQAEPGLVVRQALEVAELGSGARRRRRCCEWRPGLEIRGTVRSQSSSLIVIKAKRLSPPR